MKNIYTIEVKNLRRNYEIHKREPGVKSSIKSLFKRKYTLIEAVKDISFTIKPGELVGFIGSNGAGKTTTLKMLSGLLWPTSGYLKVLGYEPFARKHDFLKQIGLIMGNRNQLWPDIPALDTFNINKEIYNIPDLQYKKTLEMLIELLDIKDVIYQQSRKMSLGQRMKCEIAAALTHKPKILFLDEPTLGLDVVMQKKIRDFIKEYNKQNNSTILLTSHYMDDVKELCKRIIIINHGELVYNDNTESLVRNYAPYKTLTPIFLEKVAQNDLEKFGKIIEFNYPKAVIQVPRNSTTEIAQLLLNKYELDDLDINEPDLETIIREIFER